MFGFVYVITNTSTMQRYIGKKQFWSNRTKRVKGRKNRKHYTIESDWKRYYGSCHELQADVQRLGVQHFARTIVALCPTKAALSYAEVEHQIKADVLTATMHDGAPAFYNGNILNRFYRR